MTNTNFPFSTSLPFSFHKMSDSLLILLTNVIAKIKFYFPNNIKQMLISYFVLSAHKSQSKKSLQWHCILELTHPALSKMSQTFQLRNEIFNKLQYLLQICTVFSHTQKNNSSQNIVEPKKAVIKTRFICYKLFTVPPLECKISG